MNVPLPKPMTLDEFLLWDQDQEGRWEFDGAGPVALTSGTRAHSALTVNLTTALSNRLRGGPCRVYNGDLQLRPADRIRYPDAFVACSEISNRATGVADPVVVFEVLSPSTASTDFVAKNEEYRSIPSVRRYVVLAADRVAATVFERRGAEWVGSLVTDRSATLDMPEIGAALPLAELYADVVDA